MKDKEQILSDYIDRLNAEKKPMQLDAGPDSNELEELMDAVRRVKSLKEPDMPGSDFPKNLSKIIKENSSNRKQAAKPRRNWYIGMASIAAVLVMAIIINLTMTLNNGDIVYAMEQAFKEIKAYHGYIEVVETNEEGTSTVQAKREIWAAKDGRYYLKETFGSQAGLLTVNNGEKKWQLSSEAKQARIFAAFPDPYRFTFELAKEIEHVKNAVEVSIVGEEQLSGRKAFVMEVTPKGGAAYKLWVDKETKLPLKKQGAMQNALQYTITYTAIDFIDELPEELMTYKLPEGYEEVHINQEQVVGSAEEAEALLDFNIAMPEIIPENYALDSIAVELSTKLAKLYFTNKDQKTTVIILQSKAAKEFKPASTAILGKLKDNKVEIQAPVSGASGVLAGGGLYAGITDIKSIRWQQEGFEYAVVGDDSLDVLSVFAKEIAKNEIQIPDKDDISAAEPQFKVPVDMTIEENEQKSVDAGHAPWKLDPVFTAQVFASLQISPEGIQGDYPVQYEAIKVLENTGAEAVVEINSDKTEISKVYLKKLIRGDETGIWTVVGYDK